MKKVLALIVAFALCITVFAGCFATSAAAVADFAVLGSTVDAAGGAATVTVSGSYTDETVQLLTVTLPDGVDFAKVDDTYVVGMKELTVDGDEGDYVVNGKVIKFLDVYTGDFSIVINVTAAANATEADVAYTVKASAEIADFDDTEVTVVTASGAVTVKAKAPEHTCDFDEYTYDVVDGNCVTTIACDCGETKTITVANTNISQSPCLNADLSAYFMVPTSALGGYSDVYATFEKEGYDNDALFTTLTDGSNTTSNNVEYLQFLYEGITSKQMSNNIDCKIYGTNSEGYVVLIAQEVWSMRTYIESGYNTYIKYAAYKNLCVLLVDLANYGAQSQITFDYNTENLVNKNVPQDLASELPTNLTDVAQKSGINISYGPDLSNKVIISMNIAAADLVDGDVLNVEYALAGGETDTATYTYVAKEGVATWTVAFDKLTAPTIYTDFTATLTRNGEEIGSLVGSVEAYTKLLSGYASIPAYAKVYTVSQYLLAYSYSADVWF